ncbi:MAG TPA: TetR/AcrR family transcriptional regulator [Acidimicrobiales bacterium]|nr:TetR/AcrR family transcriptional regulator [Acidimicrobiales bacterium]
MATSEARATGATDGGGRQALIDATVAAIEEDGLAGVSLRAITRRAAVSHAAPAHHFGDKAGLFTAVAVEGFRDLEGRLTEALRAAREQGPAERLQALGVAYVTFATSHRAHFEVMFRPELLRPDDPELLRAGLATFALLRDAVQSAQDDGFGQGWNVDELALAAWALVHGIVQLTTYGVLGQFGLPVTPVALTASLTRFVSDVIATVGRR